MTQVQPTFKGCSLYKDMNTRSQGLLGTISEGYPLHRKFFFSKWLYRFTYLPAEDYSSIFSTSLPTLIVFCLFEDSHSSGCEWHFIVVLVCISLITNDVEHHFISQLLICIISLVKCQFKYFSCFSLDCLTYYWIIRCFHLWIISWYHI